MTSFGATVILDPGKRFSHTVYLFTLVSYPVRLTSASSLIIEYLINTVIKETGVAYFYCDYADEEIQAVDKVIASLLKQLCLSKSSIPIHIKELHNLSQRTKKSSGPYQTHICTR